MNVTTLQQALDALLSSINDVFPGTTGAQVRAVWDKVRSRSELTAGFETYVASVIELNRATLEFFFAKEAAPNKAALYQQIRDILPDLRNDRDRVTWTAAQHANAARRAAGTLVALIRILDEQFNGTN